MADITRYVNTASSAGGDGTTNATTGENRAFATLAEGLATIGAESTDHYIFLCEGQNADVGLPAVNTTASIAIRANPGATYGEHGGYWDVGAYRITPGHGDGLNIQCGDLTLEGIQIQVNLGYVEAKCGVRIIPKINGSTIIIDKCIIREYPGEAYAAAGGIFFSYRSGLSGCTAKISNTIIEGFDYSTNANAGIITNETPYVIDVYNCVISGCNRGIRNYGDKSTITVRNCAVFNNADDFNGTISVSYTASDDNDISGTGNVDISPGATESTDWAAAFTDYAGGDFSVKDTDSCLYLSGIGPASDSDVPASDIIGNSRSGAACNIGAFEGIAGTTSAPPTEPPTTGPSSTGPPSSAPPTEPPTTAIPWPGGDRWRDTDVDQFVDTEFDQWRDTGGTPSPEYTATPGPSTTPWPTTEPPTTSQPTLPPSTTPWPTTEPPTTEPPEAWELVPTRTLGAGAVSINWLPGPAWVQEVVLDGQNYQLRAIWNDGFGYWTLDILDGAGSVIVAGLRLVPNWELIRRYGDPALPPGYLTAYTITGQPEVIGYEDFINGVALLVYEPA